MDSFTIAVLVGGAIILLIFVLMVIFDKKPDLTSGPAKPAGKRSA